MEIEEKTSQKNYLRWVRIKVKGDGEFIPNEVEVESKQNCLQNTYFVQNSGTCDSRSATGDVVDAANMKFLAGWTSFSFPQNGMRSSGISKSWGFHELPQIMFLLTYKLGTGSLVDPILNFS